MSQYITSTDNRFEFAKLGYAFNNDHNYPIPSQSESLNYITFRRKLNDVEGSINCCFSQDVLVELCNATTLSLQEVVHQIYNHVFYQLSHRKMTQITAFFKRISKAIIVTVDDSSNCQHITVEFRKE